MHKDLAASLSLANLCFMVWWKYLIIQANHYYWKEPPAATAYVAIVVNVLLLALLFFAVIRLARKHAGERLLQAGRVVFLIALLLVLNHARMGFFLTTAALTRWVGAPLAMVLLVSVIAIAIVVAVRWPSRILHGQPALVLFPFVFVTFGNAVLQMVRGGGAETLPLAAPFAADSSTQPRIVWVVFDELDYRLAFSARERAVTLPELDRFRAQALDASNAFPPAEHTVESMVALISGRLLDKGEPVDSDEFAIDFRGGPRSASWGEQASVFTDTRARRGNTAVAGWFHSYCRVLARSLTRCLWEPMHAPYARAPLLSTMAAQARSLPLLIPFSRLVYRDRHTQPTESELRTLHLASYRSILEAARTAVSDPALGMVLAHLPVPHSPYIYDRQTGELTEVAGPEYFPTYVDNLVLTDRTFAELRRAMESAGLWERTTVLVTADHSLRGAQRSHGRRDERVPFILKLAGQGEGVVFETPFNTVATRALVAAIAHGSVSTPLEASEWLSAHALREPPTRIRR